MIVKDIAEFDVKTVTPDADLATAAKLMWDGDCGAIPVVNAERKVVGMITDRDICIAAATRSARPADLQVKDVMSGATYTCSPTDDIRAALKIMREQRVRRLPVVDNDGRLVGILSINDLILASQSRAGSVPTDELFATLKAISAHQHEHVTA